mgnify:CR=1 FL=1
MAWEKATDEQGQTYYYNTETGATSWTDPNPPAAGTPRGLNRRPSQGPFGLPTTEGAIGGVKAARAAAEREAEGIAPRLSALQAVVGDLGKARADAQSRAQQLNETSYKAAAAAQNAIQVAAAAASQAHGSADAARRATEARDATAATAEEERGFRENLFKALAQIRTEYEAAAQTQTVCDAEVGAAVAEAADADQAFKAAEQTCAALLSGARSSLSTHRSDRAAVPCPAASAQSAAHAVAPHPRMPARPHRKRTNRYAEAKKRGEDARRRVVETEARSAQAAQETVTRQQEALQWAEQAKGSQASAAEATRAAAAAADARAKSLAAAQRAKNALEAPEAAEASAVATAQKATQAHPHRSDRPSWGRHIGPSRPPPLPPPLTSPLPAAC